MESYRKTVGLIVWWGGDASTTGERVCLSWQMAMFFAFAKLDKLNLSKGKEKYVICSAYLKLYYAFR